MMLDSGDWEVIETAARKSSWQRLYDAMRSAAPDVNSRVFSELCYALGRHGYRSVEDIAELRLSEAATWWRVGNVKLGVLGALGAIDDIPEREMTQKERIGKSEALCRDLYLCYASRESGCAACPFYSDGCRMPPVEERMEELGLMPQQGRLGTEEGR